MSPAGGYTGTVTLFASPSAPSGITGSALPSSVTLGTAQTSLFTVSTPSSTEPGFYFLSLTGSDGSITKSLDFTIIVKPGDFYITGDPSFMVLTAGETCQSTVSATGVNGFTDTIALTFKADAGLTASVTPASVDIATATPSTLLVSANSNTQPGFYMVVVNGTSTGKVVRQTSVDVIVIGPDFGLSALPNPISFNSGSTMTATITLNPVLGFTDPVNLSVSSDPNLNASILPKTVTSSSYTATLNLNSTIPGVYLVDVAGSTASGLSHDLILEVTVLAVGVAQDFSLSAGAVSPSSILAGEAGTSSITVTPQGGFTGPISFSVSAPAPSGLVCQTPADWTGSNTPVLSCSATAAGDYTVTVTGSATLNGLSGQLRSTSSILFHVVDFSIGANPTTSTVTAGVAGTSTITISAQNSFTGAVTISTDHSECSASPGSVSDAGTSDLSCTFTTSGTVTVSVTGQIGSLSHSVTVTFTVNPAPDFTISASNPSSFNPGATGSSTISIVPTGGFTGTVDLSATVSPSASPAVSFNPSQLSYSYAYGYPTSTATFSFSTPGSYTVTVKGTSGSIVRTATVQVTVNAPDFSVSSNPTTLTIQAGSSDTSTITVSAINGFTGTVALTGSASPSGPTVTLTSNNVAGSGTSTITVDVGSDVAAGSYTVTVKGTSGSLEHSASVTVTVKAAQNVPTAPSTILGLAPTLFYSIIGIIAVVLVAGLAVVLRARTKAKK